MKWTHAIWVSAAAGLAGMAGMPLASEEVAQPAPGIIRPSADGTHFVDTASGAQFVAWGFNYDHDAAGRLIEDYWEAEWAAVEEDFREMSALGANLVRIHLQTGKFMLETDAPNPAALKQLGRLIRLAEQTGLRLDLTGLGCYHRRDVPAWYDRLDEKGRWDVQARFWEAVAQAGAGSAAVFAYDLMNEPILPGAGKKESEWLTGELGGKHFVQRLTLDLAGRPQEAVAKAWVDRMASAIRKHDPRHMITVGVIPWVYVFPKAKPLFYSPEVSRSLDFASVHFYPERGDAEGALRALAAYDIGKPLVIEEMFPLKCSLEDMNAFIDGSRPRADGWITFYWGRTIEEYRAPGAGIAEAVIGAWLDYFQKKTENILGRGRP
ncbi:MAG TPA: cellulase family glycosylhydrolase [Candidatus Paceibacterota bacterium]|nr:cellulase family glycosylhydrolase [Verrucomicrobiota bacterium]HRZ43638.1 cellulase family glycosylhydrolase [Candidatus Paceibacterota bacterium]HRZ91752.1 cellulase family glycosylhydrolase [Candidatus Paceibacterota bacterium]